MIILREGGNGCQEKSRKNLFPTLEHWQLSVWQARLETSKILLEAIVNDNLFMELLIYLRDSHILILFPGCSENQTRDLGAAAEVKVAKLQRAILKRKDFREQSFEENFREQSSFKRIQSAALSKRL